MHCVASHLLSIQWRGTMQSHCIKVCPDHMTWLMPLFLMQIWMCCSQRTSCCRHLPWIGPLEAHFLSPCQRLKATIRSSPTDLGLYVAVGIAYSIGSLYNRRWPSVSRYILKEKSLWV